MSRGRRRRIHSRQWGSAPLIPFEHGGLRDWRRFSRYLGPPMSARLGELGRTAVLRRTSRTSATTTFCVCAPMPRNTCCWPPSTSRSVSPSLDPRPPPEDHGLGPGSRWNNRTLTIIQMEVSLNPSPWAYFCLVPAFSSRLVAQLGWPWIHSVYPHSTLIAVRDAGIRIRVEKHLRSAFAGRMPSRGQASARCSTRIHGGLCCPATWRAR